MNKENGRAVIQTNKSMPHYVHIGEELKYDPAVMPLPYQTYAVVDGGEEVLKEYRDDRMNKGFYKVEAETACRLIEESGYRVERKA